MKLLRGWGASALVVPLAVLAGCGDVTGLDFGAPGSAEQAAAPTPNPTLAAAVITEGQAASLNFGTVCVDDNTDVTLTVDFNDPNDPPAAPNETRTIVADGVFPVTAACSPRRTACDASLGVNNPAACAPFLHTFPDDVTGVVGVQTTVQQSNQQTLNTINLTVNNVVPVVSLVRNLAQGDLEGRPQIFTASVVDPGTLATEIKSVQWTFTDAANVADPTTISCTCQPTVVCRDQANAPVAGGEPLCSKTPSTRTSLFLQGRTAPTSYVTTVSVIDESDASASDVVNLNVRNEAPQGATIAATTTTVGTTRPLTNATLSLDGNAPTEVAEGTLYTFAGDYTEAGADDLTIAWDLDTGRAGGTSSALQQITKASYPTRVGLTPVDGLRPTFIHTIDSATPVIHQLRVTDNDNAASLTDRFVRVVDVSPRVTLAANVTSTSEGGTITFTATALSGALDDATADPINTTAHAWTFDGVVAANVSNALTIVSGCTASSLECVVRFLDNDPAGHGPSWVVGFTARDEDSTTTATPVTVSVTNVIPTIAAMTINGTATAATINEGVAAAVVVTGIDPALALDGAYTLSITFGDGSAPVTASLAALAGASPGSAFSSISKIFVDNDVCTNPGSNNTTGVCTVTAQICEASPFQIPGPQVLGFITACSAASTMTLTVNNVGPSVVALAPATLVEGSTAGLNGDFTDPAEENDDPYAFLWTWTDGPTAVQHAVSPVSVNYAARSNGVDVTSTAIVNVPAAGADVTFRLNVLDKDGILNATNATVTRVRDAVPNVALGAVQLTNGGNELSTPSLQITATTETLADPLSRIVVEWGDGTESVFTGVGTVITPATQFNNSGLTVTFTATKPSPWADSDSDHNLVGRNAATTPWTIKVSVFDEEGGLTPNAALLTPARNPVASTTASVVNVAPVISAVVPNDNPVIVSEGQAAAFIVTTSDVSPADRPDLVLSVDWGDGSAVEPFAQSQATGADQIFRAAHVYNAPGTKTASFIVRDREGGASTATTRTIEVVNLAPTITDLVTTGPVPEGVPVTVAALTDNRGADSLLYAFDFACGVTPVFGVEQQSAVANTTYANDGLKDVCVRVCDDDNQPNSCNTKRTTIRIDNAVPVITSITAPTTINEGGTVSLTASATDLGATDVLSFTFDCGANGTAIPAVIGSNVAGTRSATTTCSYPTSGRFIARVSVGDEGTVAATQTTTITVTNLAPSAPATVAATAVNEGSESIVVATAAAPGAGGAPSRFEFDLDNNNIVDATADAAGGSGTARITFGTDGNKTVKARACDTEGACSAFTTGTVVVTNVAPVITLVSAPATVRIGSPVTVSAEATDIGRDVLGYRFEFLAGATVLQTVTTSAPLATVTINQVGTITARVTVTDTATAPATPLTATSSKTFAVTSDGSRVSFSSSAVSVDEGGSITLTASAVAEASGLFDFSIKCSETATAVVSTDDADGTVTQSCAYRNNGSFIASVSATDANGVVESRTLLVVVGNVAPTTPVASVTTVAPFNEGSAVAFTAASTDVGADDVLRFEYDFDNNGSFEVSSTTAAQSFAFARDGAFVVKVRACDNDNACSATTSVNVTIVNVAPAIALNGVTVTPSVVAGAPVTASVVASDAGNDALTYTFVFTNGTTTTTVGPQSIPVASFTPSFSGTGSVSVTVSDGTLTSVAQTASFTVNNEAPRITSFVNVGNVDASEGGSVTYTASATDRGGGTLTFQIDCTGNGPSLDDPAAGTTGTCTYSKSGTVAATVTVTDIGDLSDTRSLSLLVRNLAPTGLVATATSTTITEGTAAALTATATDAGGDALRFEYDFDDNGTFEVSSTTGSASFQFPEDGVKSVKVRACDDENACTATSSVVVTVTNVLPVIAAIDVPGSSLVGAAVTVSVDASDVGNDTLRYAFELASLGTGIIRVPATGFSTSPVASTTLREVGSYTVTAIVIDTVAGVANTTEVRASAGLTVTDISVNVTANANPAVINEGETTDINVFARGTGPYLVSYDLNADGDFDDVGVDVKDLRCAGTPAEPCERNDVLFKQNRVGDLSFRVLVQVIDEGQNNLLSTAIVAVEVRNVAPTIDGIDDASIDEDESFSTVAIADDVGIDDDLFFAVVAGPEGLTIDEETGEIRWLPTFLDIGENTVEISVTDSDDAATTTSFTVTVEMVDENGNGISDGEERSLNDGELFCADAEACDALGDLDSDNDGISDLDELFEGTSPTTSDAPGAPTIVSPINGVEVSTPTPTLTVANASNPRGNGLTYTFCIAVDGEDDRCLADVAAGETTTSVVFDDDTALVEGTIYTWYAFASDAFTDGPQSAEGSFVVDADNSAPGAPDALSPANEASLLEGSTVSLEARAVTDSDGDSVSYVFVVASDAAFNQIVTTSAARAVPLFTVDRHLAAGTYFWRATASDGTLSTTGAGASFDIVAVETNVAPGAPGITAPSNETVAATSATLTITAGSDADGDTLTYEFEIADNAAFANAETASAQAGLTFAVSDLTEDSTYFWRARSFDGALYSDWSTASFDVDASNGAPTGLAILSPTDGALLAATPTTFVVSNASDVEGDELTYTFTIASDAAFANVVATGTGVVDAATTSFALTDTSVITAGVGYFWRVEASDGEGSTSAEAGFTVFKSAEEPTTPTPSGGGCGCSSSSEADVVGFALVGLVAVLGRRRRRA